MAFGTVLATAKVSPDAVAPIAATSRAARTKPRTRETAVPPAITALLRIIRAVLRWGCFASPGGGGGRRLLRRVRPRLLGPVRPRSWRSLPAPDRASVLRGV